MWIAFQFARRGVQAEPSDAHPILGESFTLCKFEDELGGPFYPQVAEEDNSSHYRLFAGLIVGEKSGAIPAVAPFPFAAAEEPDGGFIALEFDKSRGTLKLASDLFNTQRWYYLDCGDSFFCANSLRYLFGLAPTKPEIDQRAVPYMLRMGYVPEPHTPLRGVRSLACGEMLTLNSDGLSIVSRARLPVHRRHPSNQFADPARLSDLLIHEVSRHMSGIEQIELPLSGGIDSRVLLACALRSLSPERIATFTFGAENSLDVEIAKKIAKLCGLRHAVLPPDSRPLDLILHDNFSVAEGVYWTVPDYPVKSFREILPERSVALSGFIGDPIFGSKEGSLSLSDTALGREEELAEYYWKGASYVNPDHISPLLDLSERDPLGLLNLYREIHGDTMMESYDFWYFGQHTVNRTLFAISPARDRTFYLMPFIARRILDAAFSLPSEYRMGQRAYFAALKAGSPDLYALPTTRNHGFPIEAGQSMRVALARAWRRIGREFDEKIGAKLGWHLYHNPRLNYMHSRELLRSRHRDVVVAAIESAGNLSIFRPKQILALKQAVSKGRGADTVLLRGLMTISQWVKEYLR